MQEFCHVLLKFHILRKDVGRGPETQLPFGLAYPSKFTN